MFIDFEGMNPTDAYHTLTQTVIPRPVAWVLSENPQGDYNLAPFSFFTPITSNPPLLMFSVGRKPTDNAFKDTRVNIEERRDFVVHIAHRELAGAMTETSRTLPHGESELANLGLELTELEGSRLPRLKDCHVALACELYDIKEIGAAPQSLVFGRIKGVYVSDDAVHHDDKNRLKIDGAKIDPLGRLGGSEYVTFGDVLKIPRPS
ncbi:flavin reductase family protein [Marinobacter qingdaonensis]|jgi:flavin reductase (DIM6/NTAB) family NADH-FMN oxidoreductase RutF|uniref:Flavin reductase family protein n=1 Tax=Marinobacter qingdaonensis TaxID=3108486 RepID=A0ABU5P298_9GAMM|nr:flavin reductase family protein [Marinobacter sp. ASW11-75]MEA1082206.1 flavin reductase family protein [Marinobacter sp. ASW11-75]MEE2761839.1 flavin reductase family protein [Pseudomonadota bacterium]MEE3118181.1 flavin reductase family protein [Pseudomonadota bacterium]